MSRAGGGSVAYAFDVLGLDRVVAITHPDDAASIAVMERLGMRFARRATGAELGLAHPGVTVVMRERAAPRSRRRRPRPIR